MAAGLWGWRQLVLPSGSMMDPEGLVSCCCWLLLLLGSRWELLDGDGKEGARGRRVQKSHSNSVTPLVPQLSRGAGGWVLDSKLDFSSNCFFQFFPGLCTFRAIWKGSSRLGAWLVGGLHAAAMTVART